MKKYCIKLISLIGILLSVIGYYYKSVPVFADGLRGLDMENGYEIRFERRVIFFSITLEEDEFDKIYPDLPNTMGVVKSYIGKSLQMQKGKNI